jgi:hypothetical protein
MKGTEMKHLKMTKTKRNISILSAIALASTGLLLTVAPTSQAATFVSLGTADSFAVLAGSGITNTAATTLSGDIGTFPTTTETGFTTLTQTGTNHAGDAITQGAKTDLTTAYNSVAGQTSTSTTGAIAATTLTPGVYNSGSSMTFGGNVILDAGGNANAVFIFQAASTITTASATNITIINSGQACNVFYSVGSSATLGTGTHLVGNILAFSSITDDGGAVVNGRLLARNALVTLNNTTVTRATCTGATPSPTSTATATPTPTATLTVTPVPCTISDLVYTSSGAGTTTGKLSWTHTGREHELFTGLPALYPTPYVYGSWTGSWTGDLVNLVPGVSYPVSVTVRSSTGCTDTASTIAFNVVGPTPTPTPTPTPQVPKVPKGSVKTGDGSSASQFQH